MDGAHRAGEREKMMMMFRMSPALSVILTVIVLLPVVSAAAPVLPQDSLHKSMGVATCASSLCHGAIEKWTNSRVLQNEFITWSRRDKHARAYSVLLNDRSKEIVRKLGLGEPAHRADLCLDCHAHNVPPAKRGEQFVMSDGVSCEACHGPAGRWLQSHVERGARHQDNLTNGLYPASDYEARARLCLSCHFGTKRKFVTHRLMAAGHPRMSFELDTFTQIQPPHFQARSAKGDLQLWDGVKIWAIGQAIAAHELLEILNDPARGRNGLFPELVLFDCHACHRPMSDLRNAGVRLGVGPGVVRLNDASLLMVQQIARRVDSAGSARFAQEVESLHRAIAAGDNALVHARAVQEYLARLVPGISAYRFSENDLKGMLLGLIDDGLSGQYGDYQGAEQAVMALQAIGDFMARRGFVGATTISPGIRKLLSLLKDDEKYSSAAFATVLSDLRSSINKGANR